MKPIKPANMNVTSKQPFFIAAICFTGVFLLLYPLYQYVFDLDGIGYLMITKRLANGDIPDAINGCWSPLQSWLLVPFYKMGVNEFTAFKFSNGVFSLGILWCVYRLMLKTSLTPVLRIAILWICIPILLAYSFFQLAGDLLLCLLLLIYINIASDELLFEKPLKNVLCGVIGGLAYLSKAYALPFFIVHFSLIQFILWKQSQVANRNNLLLKNLVAGIGTLLLLAAPWVYALYGKYHFFTFSYAGRLNMSWELAPKPVTDAFAIGGPPNATSPAYWEDPYLPPPYYHAFTSKAAFAKQIKVLLHNIVEALQCFHLISFLSLSIVLAGGIWLVKNKDHRFTTWWLMAVILPSGYLLMHIEPRYIWAVTFLVLIAGTIMLQQALSLWKVSKPMWLLCWCIYFGSFLPYPANLLQDKTNEDRPLFELANTLKQQQIRGKLACREENLDVTQKLAYLTGNQCYLVHMADYTYDQLGRQLKEAGIPYFFYYYQSPQELELFRQTTLYGQSPIHLHMADHRLVIVQVQ
ncbi:MAG: hypothetical protein QM731_10015 [Chitinophagaceae bacterium]